MDIGAQVVTPGELITTDPGFMRYNVIDSFIY